MLTGWAYCGGVKKDRPTSVSAKHNCISTGLSPNRLNNGPSMTRRRKRRAPYAAISAFAFNALLAATAVLGARVMEDSFGGDVYEYATTAEGVAATRIAMDRQFKQLTSPGVSRRESWAEHVGDQVDAGNLAAARGFLLAGLAMLEGDDAQALRAAIGKSKLRGDEAILDAAPLFLTEDVRQKYDRATSPTAAAWRWAVDAADVDDPALDAFDPIALEAPLDLGAEEDVGFGLQVLGDQRDLTLVAGAWVRDDPIDTFAFTLSGLGQTLMDPGSRAGASVVISARRAQRLNEALEIYLERELNRAVPPQRLKRLLRERMRGAIGLSSRGEAVAEAFRASVDLEALAVLEGDLRRIRDIARATSPESAIALLENAQNGADLRRARLAALAGGDRAVALAIYDGAGVLNSAQAVVPWSNALRVRIAALAAAGVLLAWLALSVAWRSFNRLKTVRRSAVYAIEETELNA